jgi:hypothetical protein
MKKLVIALLLVNLAASGQQTGKDTSWKVSGFAGINAGQTSLSNWQGGGQDNVVLGTMFNLEAVYTRDAFENWTTKIDLQYGLNKAGASKTFKKNADQIFVLTKYSTRSFSKKWFYSAQADYRTQFAPGYNYAGDSISGSAVSDFNSPGYIQLALGLDYRPKEYLSITFAPVSGKVTMVNRQYLADAGTYGTEKAVYDENGNLLQHGKKVRYEFGGRVIVKFKKDIMTNVNWDSYLDLFTNYLVNPGNVDVVFNNTLAFKINKFLTATVQSQILYDDDVIVRRDWDKDGKYITPGDIYGPRVQALTTLALGIGYKF